MTWNEVQDDEYASAMPAIHDPEAPGLQVTTKIPPSYDGRTSWFAYEEAVDDWCDITELPEAKRGPALKSRLLAEAAVYKPLLDRDALKNEQDGVEYFKRMLRPHFVKGSQHFYCGDLSASSA